MATCGEPKSITSANTHQFESQAQISVKLPKLTAMHDMQGKPLDPAPRKALIVTERLNPFNLGWGDLFKAKESYRRSCSAWRQSLEKYSAGFVLYADCEMPTVEPACCGNLYMHGFGKALLYVPENTQKRIDKVSSRVYDPKTEGPGARELALTEFRQKLKEWTAEKEKLGSALVYLHCGPPKVEYGGKYTVFARCTVFTAQ